MTSQKNLGFGNSNKTINIINGLPNKSSDLLQQVSKQLDEEDSKINALLRDQVLINKTGEHEAYSTEKIIRSLLNLGVPLLATYEIAESTICKIYEWIRLNENTDHYLSTKEIRKMVSLSIQEIKNTKYTFSEIESWTNKYSRRYGHNNRCVEIYWKDTGEIKEVSYEYICGDFLDNVILKIANGADIDTEITSRHRREMATEILNFINHCDLYRIHYELLEAMIIEIATQPPHPWIIDDQIRGQILEYDFEALDNNIQKIDACLSFSTPVPQSAELEVLHHASALILGLHNYFFGCYDLSAFYQLHELLKNLICPDYWNDAIQRSKLNKLLEHFSFAAIDVNRVIELMSELQNFIRTRNLSSGVFAQKVVEFGRIAEKLYQFGDKEAIMKTLVQEWDSVESSDVIIAIKSLLYTVFPCRKYYFPIKTDTVCNHFWMNYKFVRFPSLGNNEIRPQLFVILGESVDMDINFLSNLKDSRTQKQSDSILLICEKGSVANLLQKRIENYMKDNGLSDHYQLFTLVKEDLLKLFDCSDKALQLDSFFSEQTILV